MSFYYPQGIVRLRVLFENFGDTTVRDQTWHEWSVVARNLKVNINSYMEADTFSASFDYRNLPFDPRIIRACGVTIHMENKKQIFDLEHGRALDPIKATNTNMIFSGFADTDKIELGNDNRSITLEGRDFTSLLIDREYLGEPISLIDRIDILIRSILDELPQTKISSDDINLGLHLDTSTLEESEIPRLSDLTGGKGPMDGVVNPRSKRSYWDKIQEIVNNAGLICYVSLNQLILTKPRNLYDRSKSKVFVYGRNISDLSFERKLGRQKGFNVRVVSLYDKSVIEARIPEEATAAWCKETGVSPAPVMLAISKAPGKNNQTGGTPALKPSPKNFSFNIFEKPVADQAGKPDSAVVEETKTEPAPYITFKIANISDKDHLVKVGEKIFEELGRQQIEGKLSTKEMLVMSPDVAPSEQLFDATKFRVGTPIEIRIDQDDLHGLNVLQEKAGRPNDKQPKTDAEKKALVKNLASRRANIVAFLKRRGYTGDKGNIAEAMADALTQFDTPFFTKGVEFTLDHESGFSMEIEFINFIQIPQHLVEGKL